MVLAGETIYKEQHASDDRIDLKFSDPDQGDFVIEFKCLVPGSESKDKTFTTDDMAVIRGKIYEVPLISASHSDFFIKFVEEPNWTV
jgi:hypothetical protein